MKRQIRKVLSLIMALTFLVTSFSAMNVSAAIYLTEEGIIENNLGEILASKTSVNNYGISGAYELRITDAINDTGEYVRVTVDKELNFDMDNGNIDAVKITTYIKPIEWTSKKGDDPYNVNFDVELKGKKIGSDIEEVINKTCSITISISSRFYDDRYTKLDLVLVKDAQIDENTTYRYGLYKYLNNIQVGAVNDVQAGIDNYLSTITSISGFFKSSTNKANAKIAAYVSDWSDMVEVDRNDFIPSAGTQKLSSENVNIDEYLVNAIPGNNFELPGNISILDFCLDLNSPYDDFKIIDEEGKIWASGSEGADNETIVGKYIYMSELYSKVLQEQFVEFKNEDFTGKTITSPDVDASETVVFGGTNGLGGAYFMARVKGDINASSLGGKGENDEYLLVERNREVSEVTHTDYLAFNFPKTDDEYRSTISPMIFEYSLLVPDLGSEALSFGVAFREDDKNTPTEYIRFSTDKKSEVIGETLSVSRFYVTPNVWNRIAFKIYPKSSKIDIIINGEVIVFENISTPWGTYFRAIRINLPPYTNMFDCFFAVDDIKMYRGVGDLVYSMPTASVTSNSVDVLVNEAEMEIYTKTALDEQQIMNVLSATDGEIYRIAKDAEGNPIAIVLIEDENLLYKNYEIQVLTEGETELLSLEKDFNSKTFTAVVKGNGETVGNMIVAEYDGNELVSVVIVPKRTIFGAESIDYIIENYNSESTYKALYWNSFETLEPAATPVQF